MARTEPLFCDCTWGAGGSTSELTLEICTTVQKFFGVDIMMHLTCTNMSVELIYDALKQSKAAGIQNILALRRDPPVGQEWTKCEDGFGNAVDLVKFIRKEYGDHVGIGVAGYPEGHIEAESYEKDMQFLRTCSPGDGAAGAVRTRRHGVVAVSHEAVEAGVGEDAHGQAQPRRRHLRPGRL